MPLKIAGKVKIFHISLKRLISFGFLDDSPSVSQLSTSFDEEMQSQSSAKPANEHPKKKISFLSFLFKGIQFLALMACACGVGFLLHHAIIGEATSFSWWLKAGINIINCPKVTCTFVVDDEVTKVTYQGIDLPFDARSTDWKEAKIVNFYSCLKIPVFIIPL